MSVIEERRARFCAASADEGRRAPAARRLLLPAVLGVHFCWVADYGGWWNEPDFHETDTAFLLARLEELWRRVPRFKPLSVGIVLLDLVPPSGSSRTCSPPTMTGVRTCRR